MDATGYAVAELQEFVSCDVVVPTGAVVSTVLDRATLYACISGWTWIVFPTFLEGGRFVTGIDGRQADCTASLVHCSFWLYAVNDEPAQVGVDHQSVAEGDVVTFTYFGDSPV